MTDVTGSAAHSVKITAMFKIFQVIQMQLCCIGYYRCIPIQTRTEVTVIARIIYCDCYEVIDALIRYDDRMTESSFLYSAESTFRIIYFPFMYWVCLYAEASLAQLLHIL